MTVWVLEQPLSAEEESHIHERTQLRLPFEQLPDLSQLLNQVECRKLIQALYPNDPPESINRRVDWLWPLYDGLHLEDLIVVPLKHTPELALAEVTERYRYAVGKNGEDMHLVGVRWYVKHVPMRLLGKHRPLFEQVRGGMAEVTSPEARTIIRARLPHSYNRFAKLKWLVLILVAVRFVTYALSTWHRR